MTCRNLKTTIGALAFCAGSFATASGARTPWAIRHAADGAFFGAGEMVQHFDEGSAGIASASESGDIAAYTLGLGHMAERSGGAYWQARLTGARGTTAYRGNAGQGMPTSGTSTNAMWTVAGRLGLVFDAPWRGYRSFVLTPYAGLGIHRWERGNDGGHGLGGAETATYARVGIGVDVAYALASRYVLSLNALAGYTFASQLTSTQSIGFDSATGTLATARLSQSLGDRPYTVFGGAISYRASHDLTISLHVRRATWSATGTAPLAAARPTGAPSVLSGLPGSRTAETTIMVQASAPF